MWSDNDIDNVFQRLNPPEPDPTPFPLDAWLRLETELDKAVIERAVRRRLWKFFAAEVAVVLLVGLGWLLWPAGITRLAEKSAKSTTTTVATAAGNAKPSQVAAEKASAAAVKRPADAALRSMQATAGTSASSASAASTEAVAAAPGLEPVPNSAAAIATVPTAKPVPSAITHLPAAVNARSGHRRRTSAESRLAYQALATPLNDRLNTRSSTAIHRERTVRKAATVGAAARTAARGGVSVIAKNTGQHPAAGSFAAPTEAPAEAIVADAASSSQLRRESQSPLLNQPTAATAAALTSDATETGASDAAASASGTALGMLAPTVAQLQLASATTLPTPLAPTTIAPADLPVAVRQPRFYIGLVAAPDLTTVKFVDVERPKLNIGVVLEYRLTNRLRVSTGLLRANKEYYARREDYDWSAYPRAQTRNFTWVDGACTVLDVPLNLRYDAVVRPQARLFGSVGLSSFFMQRERYSYDYTEYNKTYLWERSYVNENRHLFSVLNLSFGYEHRLGTHLSLQAEPYVKLPLGGVGAGKVQLTSGGVFFGAKYGF
jgi:hypothetical protein